MLSKLFDKITRLSIRFRWITIALTAIFMAVGIYSATQLNLEMTPRVDFPQTVVVVQWPDAEDANQFLEEVTIPLEDKLRAVENVVNVESTTQPGLSFIIVRNEFGQNQDAVLEDIKEAVASTTLPDTAESQVLNFGLSDLPIVVSSISSPDLTLQELKEVVESEMQPRIEGLPDVSQVSVGGGQELPDETETEAAAPEPTVEPTAAPDPGRLPVVVVEGAKSLGVEVEYVQDVTPDVLAGLDGTNEQIMAIMGLIPAEDLIYAPAETLSLLPSEFMDTLDNDLVAELNELAADYGGVGQYTIDEARVVLNGEEEVAEAEPTAEPTPEPTAVPVEEETEEAVAAVDLPASWIEGAKAAGIELATTADLAPEIVEGIVGFAPELLADLTPEMLLALSPETLAALPEEYFASLDAETLQALADAQAGEETVEAAPVEPVDLPAAWIEGAKMAGIELATTADLSPEIVEGIVGFAPELLAELTPEMLLALSPETLAALPPEYMAELDPELLQALADAHMSDDGGEEAPGIRFEPVALPESWIAGAEAMGQTISTTADITPELMGGILQIAPEQLAELTPEMWRALDLESMALGLTAVGDTLDPDLAAQLEAIQNAAVGVDPKAVDLPASWVEMSSAAGFPMETTADIPLEAAGMLTSFPPEMMGELTNEILLAMHPDLLSALPEELLANLDEGMAQTVANIAIAREGYLAMEMANETETTEETVAEATPEPTPEPVDPARLPDFLIQGAKSAGVDIEFAQDLDPDFVRLFAGLGPQGVQALGLLTPDNLRLMQPESIALLPMEFLDTLDADLRAELDEIAAEFGGAGQLALTEAAEAEAASGDSPELSGMWREPGPDGEPGLFTTAYDLLNNSFAPGAAALLNFIPDSPNGDPQLMYDLTPDVMKYLAENEEDFVENLSPIILELMSPETLTFLLDEYPDAFDADLAENLRGIAAGDVEVFIPESSITRTDGNPSVLVAIYKDGDANTVEVAHAIFDDFDEFTAANPNIEVDMVFEQATFIEDSISGVARDGALGGVFAILIILVFLSGRVGGKYKLSWRATLVTAVSIPLSIFSAFFFMNLIPPTMGTWMESAVAATNNGFLIYLARLFPTNITLNIMTLSGLTVAIGRVVDDSIVVLENSYRHIQQGDDLEEAIIAGTKEVAVAIFSATVTTMVVFLPLGLIGGLIGSFFLPFGLTVTYALIASFVVSITAVPALMSLLINKNNIPEEKESAMQRWYTPMLEWSLNHRAIVMGVSTLIFLSSLYLLGQLPQSFIPSFGEPTVNVAVKLPNGTKMVDTNALVEEFETTLATIDGIETVQVEIGSAGGFEALMGGGGISQNIASITITIEDQEEIDRLTKEVRQEALDIFGEDNAVISAGGETGFGGFALTITGDSLDELIDLTEDVKSTLGTLDVDGDGQPDIANVDSSVDALLQGNGGNDTIIRIDGKPAVSFGGELETADTLGVTNAAKQAVIDMNLPSTVTVTEGFDSQQQVEGFQSMIKAIGISIILVYLIMALAFRSLLLPFTILFSLPFALVGAAIALFITNSNLGISAMIGFMMLVGVVVTNGIVLMELVKQLREKGNRTYDALVGAGRTRLRPIWMTALTAILALVPLAASQEAGAIIAAELGKAVMGGLIVGTALTLIVVPVVYSMLDQLSDKIRGKSNG